MNNKLNYKTTNIELIHRTSSASLISLLLFFKIMKKLLFLFCFVAFSYCYAEVNTPHDTLSTPHYSINNFNRSLQQHSAVFAVRDSTIRPKISLDASYYFGDIKSLSGAPMVLYKGFYVDDGNREKLGFLHNRLGKYLKCDPQAYKFFKTHRTFHLARISLLTLFIADGLFALTDTQNDPKNDKLKVTITVSLSCILLRLAFNEISKIKLRESVKTYNKNAGYGYTDGIKY